MIRCGFDPTPPVHRTVQGEGKGMNTRDVADSMSTLLGELVNGAPEGGAYMLNPKDAGLLRSLDALSAEPASASSQGGATIAAHVDHLRYGLSLMNRWAAGENPFADADWSRSWETGAVTEEEWRALRDGLASEARRWLTVVAAPRDAQPIELNGMLGSIAHLAYHLGAIRQIDRSVRGPAASD
jgi:hypothetical protein